MSCTLISSRCQLNRSPSKELRDVVALVEILVTNSGTNTTVFTKPWLIAGQPIELLARVINVHVPPRISAPPTRPTIPPSNETPSHRFSGRCQSAKSARPTDSKTGSPAEFALNGLLHANSSSGPLIRAQPSAIPIRVGSASAQDNWLDAMTTSIGSTSAVAGAHRGVAASPNATCVDPLPKRSATGMQ